MYKKVGGILRAVCIGNSSYDITLPVEKFPKENTKIRTNGKVECGGGPASNGAYLLAKWNMETSFAGIVGNDYYGQKIIEEFREIGVDITYLEKTKEAATTSSYIIANLSDGTRTIVTNKDKNLIYTTTSIDEKFDVILVDGEELEISKQVLLNNKDAISILDAGKIRKSTLELGPLVKYFVCSKEFSETFTSLTIDYNNLNTIVEIHNQLEKHFNTNIIITLEEKGCFAKIDNGYILIPSIKVKALDSTGAGDIFHGAFTYFISNNYSLKDSLMLANITGAISVTRIGSRLSIPTLDEVIETGVKYGVYTR